MYNYNNDKDTSILNATEPTDNDNYPILRSEVVSAIQSLKSGKSPGVDNITGELLKSGGENMISVISKERFISAPTAQRYGIGNR